MSLLPKVPGLKLENAAIDAETVSLTLASTLLPVACPICGQDTSRLHSHYGRTVADLPWGGRRVRLSLNVRKFRCSQKGCPRRIFTERLPDLVRSYARKTVRLREIMDLVGFALGGEAGARLVRRLGMAVSPSTLLRYVWESPMTVHPPPTVIGVDDFSLRRGQSYATIIVDLERHEPIDLLPDREAETLANWLRANPGIEVIARDRYRPYIEGATAGAPGAVQVADRFHVLKNLYDAVERAVERNRHVLREPDAASEEATIAVPAEGTGYPGWGHRSDPEKREQRLRRYQRVVELRERGLYVEDIADQVGLSRSTVVSWLNADGFPERKRPKKKKPSPVAPYAEYLERRWKERCINMSRLWREIKEMGYEGSYDAVADHLRCLRKGLQPPACAPVAKEGAGGPPKGSRYESQEAARLLMLESKEPEALRPEQSRWLKQLRQRSPELAQIQDLAGRFAKIMREGEEDKLSAWLKEAEDSSLSEIRTFAKGVRQDEAAIRAAITLPWSSGQVEGQVNRLKLIKREMYGRASFGLLRQRVLGGA